MIRLYSTYYCPYALRTRMVLEEKRLPYERSEIDLKNKPADFHKVSPYGKVPVLVEGETRVYESAIINEYLDEKYPDPPLMPPTPEGRGRGWMRAVRTGSPLAIAIGIGGSLAAPPLPHHRTCGSASGGSAGYTSNRVLSFGSPSERKKASGSA